MKVTYYEALRHASGGGEDAIADKKFSTREKFYSTCVKRCKPFISRRRGLFTSITIKDDGSSIPALVKARNDNCGEPVEFIYDNNTLASGFFFQPLDNTENVTVRYMKDAVVFHTPFKVLLYRRFVEVTEEVKKEGAPYVPRKENTVITEYGEHMVRKDAKGFFITLRKDNQCSIPVYVQFQKVTLNII